MVKNSPAMQETQIQSLGLEDPLEKEMATHASILAWRIPWTEEPGATVHGVTKESDTTEGLNSNNEKTSCFDESFILGSKVSLTKETTRYTQIISIFL